jgi:hypothetical protein
MINGITASDTSPERNDAGKIKLAQIETFSIKEQPRTPAWVSTHRPSGWSIHLIEVNANWRVTLSNAMPRHLFPTEMNEGFEWGEVRRVLFF